MAWGHGNDDGNGDGPRVEREGALRDVNRD